MGHKHLHELLKEDQEPFHLNTYISNNRIHIKSNTSLNIRKGKPVIQSTSTSTKARNFCINNVCFLSFHESPDVRKSPFLDIKSPFHVPSRTASMLLDAAMRIHKPKKPKPDFSGKVGFRLFGSLLKRLKDRRTRKKRREISLLSYDSQGCDLEDSCSTSLAHDLEEVYDNEYNGFVLSPFRFSLVNSPSTGCRTPDFVSPMISPNHLMLQEKEECEGVESQKIHLEEEDKEQCSPVSVLDPLIEDDEEEDDVGALVEHGYDLECCYANVQRAKQQLLQKLQRFEKLAKLDPIELDKHMSEQSGDDIEENLTTDVVLREIIKDIDTEDVPTHIKRLVLDLIHEESKNELERDVVTGRVIGRLDSWKMVESNTIDMMVELDFSVEKSEGWRSYDALKIKETGMDIEVAIFGFLTQELAQELAFS